MDPRPFSLRELVWMCEAKQVDDWNHTAQLLAMQVNTAFGRKGRLLAPREFHPLAKQKQAHAPKLSSEESRSRLKSIAGLTSN